MIVPITTPVFLVSSSSGYSRTEWITADKAVFFPNEAPVERVKGLIFLRQIYDAQSSGQPCTAPAAPEEGDGLA